MKTSTKVTIGLSIAAVAGIASVAIASDKLADLVRHKKDRRQVRRFVDDKFNGNEKLLSVVDNLSDDDIDSLMGVMRKLKNGRNQISVYGDNIKDTTSDLKDKLMGLIDHVL